MVNVAGMAESDNTPNYLGPFFVLGANQIPFISRIGYPNGFRPVVGFTFPVTEYASLETAAQTTVSEDTSIAGPPEAVSYVKAQEFNVIQTMHRSVKVSYAKIADRLAQSGIQYATDFDYKKAELDFQTEMTLIQLAVDMEFSIFQGAYAARTNSAANAKTRGLVGTGANGAINTNLTNAGTAALTTTLIDGLVKKMADAGAPFRDPVMWVNSWQKQKISSLYGWSPVAPPGAGLGGTAVQVIETDFARIPVMFAPKMLATAVAIVEMSEMKLAGLTVGSKGAIFLEPLAKDGASEKYQLYAQLGLDYGNERHSGAIYGLTVA